MFTCLALHPWEPFAIGGGLEGAKLEMDLLGIEYGPLVVCPRGTPDALAARCPACGTAIPVARAQLGDVVPCPGPTCGRRLRLTTFWLGPTRPLVATSRDTRPSDPARTGESTNRTSPRRRRRWPFPPRRGTP